MTKLILCICHILICFSSASQNINEKQQYIFINYSTGNVNKPYQRFLIYTPGSLDPYYDTIATDKLEIPQRSFAAYVEAVFNNHIERDSLFKSDNLFDFHVRDSAETKILLTGYVNRTRQIISDLSKQLVLDKASEFSITLQSLFDRVYFENFKSP